MIRIGGILGMVCAKSLAFERDSGRLIYAYMYGDARIPRRKTNLDLYQWTVKIKTRQIKAAGALLQ